MSGCRPRIPRDGHTGHTGQTFFVSAKKGIYIFLADLTFKNRVQPVQNHANPCGTKATSGLTGFFLASKSCLPNRLSCPVRFSSGWWPSPWCDLVTIVLLVASDWRPSPWCDLVTIHQPVTFFGKFLFLRAVLAKLAVVKPWYTFYLVAFAYPHSPCLLPADVLLALRADKLSCLDSESLFFHGVTCWAVVKRLCCGVPASLQ